MKKVLICAALLFAGWALGGPIHTWSVGEYITASDLNASMQHMHNNMVGGHGPRLRNSDVSGTAAIAHSKLATPALLPKAWVSVQATCATPATCTMADSSGITSVVGTANTGEYTVTFPTRGDVNYMPHVSAYGSSADLACHTAALTATTATVICITASTGAAVDAAFSFILLDTEN